MPTDIDTQSRQFEVTQSYDRMAWLYDVYDAPMEILGLRKRRRRVIPLAYGETLEVGVGTGKNLAHYGPEVKLWAVDLSFAMLERAKRRASRLGRQVNFDLVDLTGMPFPDDAFDTTVATSVFCSVAAPVEGLRELGRVTKPDGQILLVEHVRPSGRLLGAVADILTAITRRVFGFRINRRTEESIAEAGLRIVALRRNGVWREIVARPGLDRGSPDE